MPNAAPHWTHATWGYGDDETPKCEPFELDHIVPLWRVAMMPSPRNRALRYWLAGNLQLLCVPCHRVKTKREAAERGYRRRLATTGQLELVPL